ncbi:MAG TPA: transglutaminase family protein [Puia sp.]|uniref:transglutaminase family protein n=1 Tax=Puia sp. TaxID=2045100 RepID=UPI002CCE21DE|nr:transglutaminase family protein [Puia sp.]HVU98726.1 transglutaminase family protein [Puia sp.]
MSIRIAINHKTTYKYDRFVSLSPHVFRLRPAVHSRTPVEAYSFKVTPKEHFINWQQDPFGNFQARVVFPEKTRELDIEVEVIANMVVINPFDFFVEENAAKYPFVYNQHLAKELVPYLEKEEPDPLLDQWVESLDKTPKPIIDFLVYLNQKLNKDIAYTVRMEAGVQTTEETLTKSLGSCRDSAWLLVQVLRRLGLAARFVSGYLVQLTADVKSLDGPSGPESDFTDLHAWTEVYIPGAGWVGMDPTSGLFAGEGHIPLACTPHYVSAAPVVGSTDECTTEFVFSNTVTRIHEDPRVTKPYTQEQWAIIDATGYKVDEDLDANDLRLTMGGEPTFVSIDDMESAQWNTAADGKEKRLLAHDLIFRLREQFAPNGMIHYGQGKWYPGEPLPRWQYGLFWRKDNVPMWQNTHLIAHETTWKTYTYADAEHFIRVLAGYLNVSQENVSAAYEDAFYTAWAQRKMPINSDEKIANWKDPAGFTLPLKWDYHQNKWKSAKWILRQELLFLLPGNSPIGLRLPLDSLPLLAKEYEPQKVEPSLFEELPVLADYQRSVTTRYNQPSTPWPQTNHLTETIKTTLCVEAREGMLYVFLPPMDYLEHYLDALASIETTAEKLQIPVRIEGYEPPRDYRLERLVVSPDPGVIEVNIHPANNWKELTQTIGTLYEQAFLSRLGTEKFMLDGRHTGTGGGNHITIGAAKPADSPLLRRPDLLRSLITYWQHHPGLSYLFSSAFIGATSQAPRIDEGLNEKLYEMEIAFSQVPEGGFIPFYLVDRIFRHLLTDITGNTHRSEFCIDKLYSPDTAAGRLGILEFRAFDMPPHKEMSLVQMLLIRALIAKFANRPYKHDLVRWGTELHDKFLLPQFVKADLTEVVADLNAEGYPFDIAWFDPFLEFRFPRYGTIQLHGITLEIRMGIEPWNVLGEEMSAAGTARYVDSSLEKLQVKCSGWNSDRYALLCNGRRVPLTSTGVNEEYVCGIRYRAWQPYSALHPTIGIDAPITFDIVDTWNSRSIGGCTYYVSHPGGRHYDAFPVNANEAESRRGNRFDTTSFHQDVLRPVPNLKGLSRYIRPDRLPFLCDPPSEEINKEYPYTLDLRRFRRNTLPSDPTR